MHSNNEDGYEARNPHNQLAAYGWTPMVAGLYEDVIGTINLPAKVRPLAEPARIVAENHHTWQIACDSGRRAAEPSGLFAARMHGVHDRPKVGDWAVVTRDDHARGVIHAVLPRRGVLIRRSAGSQERDQLLAANVDSAFIICGLDRDFNVRRIERYLVLVRDGGAEPVIVLSKSDLCEDLGARLAEVAAVADGARAVAVSALHGIGLEPLAPYLAPGRTVAVLGSSGAGKSSLVNVLLGTQRQMTCAVRADDARGRHTTTVRSLIPLPGGAVIIDTPGMREVGLALDAADVGQAFSDISELAPACRFRDCSHRHEPGCAVLAAVEAGEIPPERLANYGKLQCEAEATAASRRASRRRRNLASASFFKRRHGGTAS